MKEITFGKYKGSKINDLPTDYLEWGVKRLDSDNWRYEFSLELKRRKNENKKRESWIKANVNSPEVWQTLIKDAENELQQEESILIETDCQYDGRIVTQTEIEQLAKKKLQKYQAEIQLEKLDAEFIKQWQVTQTQINKIQDEFWTYGLQQHMFSSKEKYDTACKLAQQRDDLIKQMYSL